MVFVMLWRVLMIVSLLPRLFQAFEVIEAVTARLDPEWSRYLREEAGPFYDESPPVEQPPKPPLTEKYNWTLTHLGESSFVAVIHRNATNADSTLSLDAGNACGGAILTPQKVLTLCACVATWYDWVKKGAKPPLVRGRAQSKYDIIAERIYVTHSIMELHSEFRTRLNNNAKHHSPRSTCPANVDDSDTRLADVLVLRFLPAIEYPIRGQIVPWPPYPEATDKNMYYVATVLGFGMKTRQLNKKFFNEFGEEIPIENRTVRFQVQKTPYSDCAKTVSIWSTLPTQLSSRVTCLGALNKTFELCGGLVGNPVIFRGAIHGLTMSEMSCEPSNAGMVVLTFDSTIRRNIANWGGQFFKKINQDLLNDEEDRLSNAVFYRDLDTFRKKIISSLGVTVVTDNTRALVCFLMIIPSFVSSINV